MKWQKHAFAAITLATRKKQSTLSMGTLRLLLSAVALMALCFSFADMALAQTATAYSKEAMEQALATKHHYDLYGIHFDFDKAVIKPDSNALLDDIATTLKHFPQWRLRITGHTDSSGKPEYNEELSMNRANAIKQALVERGIDAARLETLGMGEKQPVASNDTPEGQALNRRVELVRLDMKPNIVVIMGDDIGMWNIGAYHRGLMAGKTPNLDKIAKEGMLFTDYYAEASCTAGRANFITGQLPIRTGMTTVGQAGASIGLPAEACTIATALKEQGYATGQFGKNHLGDKNEFLPTVHGFDEFFGYLYHLDAMEDPAHPNYPQDLLNVVGPRNMVHSWATDVDDPTEMPRWGKIGKQKIEDAGTLYPERMKTVDNEIRDLALNFMEKAQKDGKPFFCWLNPTRMHIVTHLSEKYEKMRNSENGWSEEEAGMAQLDDDVGLVMQKLKDMGVDDNTIVVFNTDNGTEVFTWPDGGQTPFAQSKGTVMEGGFRVPCILRWPGHVPADSVQNGIFSGMDWFPTFLDAAGNPDITDQLLKGVKLGDRTYKNHLDGYDQMAAITGKGPSARHEIFYLGESTVGAVRIDDYKYRFIDQPQGWLGDKTKPDVPYITNLRLDPFERTGWPNEGTKEGAQQYFDWFKYQFWRFVFVQKLMAKEIQTFLDYPPMQRGASFNLDAVKAEMAKKMQQAEAASKGTGQ
jgi:arylsulfatase A-like enzyme